MSERDDRREPTNDDDASDLDAAQRDHDEVDVASEMSFPASDPPSWVPLHPGAPSESSPAR